MIKCFAVNSDELEDKLYPTFYLFKERIKSYSKREDIVSFNLGDKDVLETLTDGEHKGQTFVEKGALFIKNSSVKKFNISELDGFYITEEKNNQLKRSKLRVDDVLFTTIGNLGVAAVVNKAINNANINQNVVRMRITKTSPQYLACYLNSKIAKFQINNLFTGNIYPIITYPKIKSIRILIKSKDIENEITNNLQEADELHFQSMFLIKKAQEIFKGLLNVDFQSINKGMFYSADYNNLVNQEMWTPAYYYPLYVNTVKAIKSKNNTQPLGVLANFHNGNEVGSSNYKEYFSSKKTDLPFIRTSDLINYEVDHFPDYYIDNEIARGINQNIQPEEIIFTKDGKIGLVGMITANDKCILSSGILRIIPHHGEINPYYLFIALSIKEIGLYQALQRTVIATTIPHLREDRVTEIVIPIIDKQVEIIDLTKKAFELKDKRKVLIKKSLKTLESSLDLA